MRVIPALTLFLLMAATAARSQVRNAELGYALILPEGFTDFPAVALPEGRGRRLDRDSARVRERGVSEIGRASCRERV